MSGLINLTPIKAVSGPPAWTPADLSPIVWFRMDQVTGSGSSLTLTQLGSNGTDATVPGGVSAPSIVGSVLNGQPILRFVAANGEYMSFGTAIIAGKDTAHDVIVVWKSAGTVPSSPGFECPLTYATHASRANTLVLANSTGYQPLAFGGGDGAGLGGVGISGYDYSSAFQYFLARYNGSGQFVNTSNWTMFKNTVSQTVVSSSGVVSSTSALNFVGAYFPPSSTFTPSADIAEIIIAPQISAGNLTSLNSYIASRYAL